MKSNQKTLDNLNNNADKIVKSLTKPKAEQLRRSLTALNDKYKEVILLLEKRQNQIAKGSYVYLTYFKIFFLRFIDS